MVIARAFDGGDAHRLAIFDGRACAEVDCPEVVQRQHAAAAAARRLFDPFGRRVRRRVLLGRLIRLAGGVVGERDQPLVSRLLRDRATLTESPA